MNSKGQGNLRLLGDTILMTECETKTSAKYSLFITFQGKLGLFIRKVQFNVV